MARLNLTNFETVCAIARLGTFAAAAQRLNASQPAITARVRELEDTLGFELFHKRGRRMELTIRGRHFIERIEPLVEGIEREVAAHAAADAAVGVVRLGVPLVTLDWIPAVVARLKLDMPGVDFEIDIDAGMSIVHKLQAGKLDVAITVAAVHDDDLLGVPLRRELMRWMVSTQALGHAAAGADLAGLLNSVPLWLVPRSSALFARVAQTLRAAGATLQNLNTCSNMAGILQMVLHTHGVGLLVDALAQPEELRGALAPLPLPPIAFDITLLAHKDQQQAVVRQVLDRIVELDARR
jgi:DNA-binding transcriptional LysR family regulator